MTELLANSLNNIEEILSNTKNQKSYSTDVVGVNKSEDFKKIFDKTVDKVKSNQSDTDKLNHTISFVKEKGLEEKDNVNSAKVVENWADFKEVLTKITEEANAETSLDLTLARDINEIISQLKDAIEQASEIIENTEETEEEIPTDIQGVFEEILATDVSETIPQDVDKKQILEQVLTFVDKSLSPKSTLEVINNDETKVIETENLSSYDQLEMVEYAEGIADEVLSANKIEITEDKTLSDDLELSLDEDVLKELKIESIRSDFEASSNESFMQQQAPEEHAVKIMINDSIETFELKIDSQQNVQNVQQVQTKAVDINPSRIIEQITKHLEGLQNNSKVNIVLNPESLGKVNIQLLSAKDGLTAQFTVTTQEAKDLLMKGLDGLKDSLLSHGVAVDNVSVKISDAQKSEYNQDWTEQEGSRGGNKNQGKSDREEKEKGLFEKMMAKATDDENGNV